MSLFSDDTDANLYVFFILLMVILSMCFIGFSVIISLLFCLLERKKPVVCKRCARHDLRNNPRQQSQAETSRNLAETTPERARGGLPTNQNHINQTQQNDQIYTEDPISSRPDLRHRPRPPQEPAPSVAARPLEPAPAVTPSPRTPGVRRVTFTNTVFDGVVDQEINRAASFVGSTGRMSSIYIEREYPDRDVESETGSQNIEDITGFNDTVMGDFSTFDNNNNENLPSHYEEVDLSDTLGKCGHSLQSESRYHHDDGLYEEVNIDPYIEEEADPYEIPDGFLNTMTNSG